MIIRNDIKKTRTYKMEFYKYKNRTTKQYSPEIFGFVGLVIIVAMLIFGGVFSFTELSLGVILYGIFEEPVALLATCFILPGLITFLVGMFGILKVYEIRIDDVKTFSRMLRVINNNPVYVNDTYIYENGYKYHFVEPCSVALEIGKTYYIAGRGRKMYFVICEKGYEK